MTSPPSRPANTPSREELVERPRPRPSYGRALVISLAVSAVLHVLIVLVYPVVMASIVQVDDRDDPDEMIPPEGLELVELAEPPDDPFAVPEEPEAPEAVEPDDAEEPDEPEPDPADPAPDDEEEDEAEDGEPVPSVAERLRVPTSGDPRIWRPVNPSLAELTPEQRARLRIYGRLGELADSLLAEEERLRAARDWTYTDDDGNRWGVSPEGLHLGELTLPLPLNFSGPPSIESQQLDWQWDDARRGAERDRIRDLREERSEAIRERRDAERADSTGSDG